MQLQKIILLNSIFNKYFKKYLVLVVIAVAIEYTVYYSLISFAHISYVIANLISVLVSFLVNWLAGRYFIFGSKNKYFSELMVLIFFTFISFVGQLCAIVVAVELFMFNPYVAKIIGLTVSFILNFFFRVKFIYRNECD